MNSAKHLVTYDNGVLIKKDGKYLSPAEIEKQKDGKYQFYENIVRIFGLEMKLH